MPRINLPTLVTTACALLAAWVTPLLEADDARVPSAITDRPTIFLAEVRSAQPGEGCAFFHMYGSGRCNTKVGVRILRVLRGGGPAVVVPVDFVTDVDQVHSGVGISGAWTDLDIQPGQRYLIFSAGKGDLTVSRFATMFRSDRRPVAVTDSDDPVGDLDVILSAASLPLSQQAAAVATAIDSRTKPRSYILSDYTLSLLAAGTDAETNLLREAIEQGPDDAFSPFARLVLCVKMSEHAKAAPSLSENFIHVYTIMTVRYFLVDQDLGPRMPDLQSLILGSQIRGYCSRNGPRRS